MFPLVQTAKGKIAHTKCLNYLLEPNNNVFIRSAFFV